MKVMKFRGMRELSYAGFRVLHDKVLMPSFKVDIPVVMKNTNNPAVPGKLITSQRTTSGD